METELRKVSCPPCCKGRLKMSWASVSADRRPLVSTGTEPHSWNPSSCGTNPQKKTTKTKQDHLTSSERDLPCPGSLNPRKDQPHHSQGLSRHRTSLIPVTIQVLPFQDLLATLPPSCPSLALPGTGTCVGTIAEALPTSMFWDYLLLVSQHARSQTGRWGGIKTFLLEMTEAQLASNVPFHWTFLCHVYELSTLYKKAGKVQRKPLSAVSSCAGNLIGKVQNPGMQTPIAFQSKSQ